MINTKSIARRDEPAQHLWILQKQWTHEEFSLTIGCFWHKEADWKEKMHHLPKHHDHVGREYDIYWTSKLLVLCSSFWQCSCSHTQSLQKCKTKTGQEVRSCITNTVYKIGGPEFHIAHCSCDKLWGFLTLWVTHLQQEQLARAWRSEAMHDDNIKISAAWQQMTNLLANAATWCKCSFSNPKSELTALDLRSLHWQEWENSEWSLR